MKPEGVQYRKMQMKKIDVYVQPDSLNDRAILQLLLDNPIFHLTIGMVRDILKLPKNGFKIENLTKKVDGNYNYDISALDKKKFDNLSHGLKNSLDLWTNISAICSSFHTSSRWFNVVYEVVLFCAVLSKPKPPIRLGIGSNISTLLRMGPEFAVNSSMDKSDRTLIIEVYEKMSVSQLKQYLDDMDSENLLSENLEKLSGPPSKPDISKVKNVDLKSEMNSLQIAGKTYSEIKKIIESKYDKSQISFQLNNQSISRYLDRYKKDSLGVVDKNGYFLSLYKSILRKEKTKK